MQAMLPAFICPAAVRGVLSSLLAIAICFGVSSHVHAQAKADQPKDVPFVADDFLAEVVAREPHVRNPCVMAFDKRGRVFVGQGPQWRGPTPTTPGDRVDILVDEDGDGRTDSVKTFARGFNSIQGLAWQGRDLWVANAPDLTIVRDLNGDDVADEYVRVYTGLGNLEHSLHGLNFGPDGKLYMSKGNSKGYNRLDQLAPKPFRELWGLKSPPGAPDYTPIETFKPHDYKKKYHTPPDDWGRQGGILRCDTQGANLGRNLEIVAQGFRNPWDIAFDDGFNWLGTDNDQTEGDKIFMPFHGAHFGWGHTWSFHWSGEGHLPSVPASAPLFEGSGAGVIHYHAAHFPPEFQNVFFINDWLKRELLVFRPKWDGALMKVATGKPDVFAHAGGGRSLAQSGDGRTFSPTDVEVAPDGTLYVLSWGQGYGARLNKDGSQDDEGRVIRIRHRTRPLMKWNAAKHRRPHGVWSLDELYEDLISHVPVWRVDAQYELVRRGKLAKTKLAVKLYLQKKLAERPISKAAETWTSWTLGRLSLDDASVDEQVATTVGSSDASLNARIQALRILAHRSRLHGRKLPAVVAERLKSNQPRLRHAAVQAIWQAKQTHWANDLVRLAGSEKDRVTFYSTWNALRDFLPVARRQQLLTDLRSGARLAALLSLAEDGKVTKEQAFVLYSDEDPRVAKVAEMWLRESGNASLVKSNPRGPRAGGLIPFAGRKFIRNIKANSGLAYVMDWVGLGEGKLHYTDRPYAIKELPPGFEGAPFLRTANNDDRQLGEEFLSFEATEEVTLFLALDERVPDPLPWMNVGREGGFVETELRLLADDANFRLFRKTFPAGRVVLGANLENPAGSRRGNYLVIFDRKILRPSSTEATTDAVLAKLTTANPARGRELFFHAKGAGCYKCHGMGGRGKLFAPDLSNLGSRSKAAAIVDSILHPSRAITEGFAQQLVITDQGKSYSGAVIQETAQAIKLVNTRGEAFTIAKDEIDERVGTKKSPMPDGFGKLMSAQQVADITAWLLTQKTIGDETGFWLKQGTDQIQVHYGKQPIATYVKSHHELTRQALVNVKTLSGIQVTRHFPTPMKDNDHGVMHPGIWLGYGDIHGNDYWRLRARVEHAGVLKSSGGKQSTINSSIKVDDKDTLSFKVRNKYLTTDASRTVCTEDVSYRFLRQDEGIYLLIDAEYKSDDADFYFGDQEESGLGVRLASGIRVQGGNGRILNDRSERNGAAIWGKEAKWIDYTGTIDGRQVGIMVVPNPTNVRRCWMHARDYGVFVVNPFPRQPRQRREPYIKTWIKKGTPYKLSYAVLIHDQPAESPLEMKAAYEKALGLMKDRQ